MFVENYMDRDKARRVGLLYVRGVKPGASVSARREEILRRIRAVPAGFVTTYRDVSPQAPRLVGQVLSNCDDPAVPWQRVVRADGSLAKGARQRRLLDAEGTPFRGRRVDLAIARIPAEALDDLVQGRAAPR